MNTARRITKNTLLLLASQIVNTGLGLFYIMYMARYLGVEKFGTLSFALAFTGIFAVFNDFGINNLMIREIARDKSIVDKYLGNIILVKVILVSITFGLIAFTINFLGYSDQTIKVVYIIALSVIFTSFTGLLYSLFQAFEKMEYVLIGRVLYSSLMLFGVFYAISADFEIVGFAWIYFFASLVGLGIIFIYSVRKFVKPKIEVDWIFWKSIIKKALPFGMSSIFVIVYFYIDSVMLSMMKGDEAVGWYNAAYRLIYVLLFIPGAFFSSVYPVMSRIYMTSEDSIRCVFETSLRYMLIIAYPIALGITLFSDKIIILIFQKNFAPSIPALQILVWAVFFSFLAHATLYTLSSINFQIIYTKVAFLGMILNIFLNLILIPKLSLIGASMSTVITEFVCFIMMFYFLKLHFGKTIHHKLLSKIMATYIIFLLIILILKTSIIIELSFILSICIYISFLFIFRIINEGDLKLFRNIFRQ